ncbi:hypothetical protein BH24ACT12_BH24ACT12_26630 [soil metagenome]
MSPGTGRIGSVNVVHEITHPHLRDSAIDKRPVAGPVHVDLLGLAGDTPCDTRHHGGRDKAVYAYASEDNDWWTHALGRAIAPGTFGENLTMEGLDVTHAVIGEHWRFSGAGGALLQVTMPRTPCTNLSAHMGIKQFHARFDATGKVGAYLRVLEPGPVRAGDPVTVEHRPGHAVTVAAVCAGRDPDVMQTLLDAEPDLAEVLRRLAERVVARSAVRQP